MVARLVKKLKSILAVGVELEVTLLSRGFEDAANDIDHMEQRTGNHCYHQQHGREAQLAVAALLNKGEEVVQRVPAIDVGIIRHADGGKQCAGVCQVDPGHKRQAHDQDQRRNNQVDDDTHLPMRHRPVEERCALGQLQFRNSHSNSSTFRFCRSAKN